MTPDEFKEAHAILRAGGHTDTDIACMLGISPARVTQTFSDWRSGRTTPSRPVQILLRGYAFADFGSNASLDWAVFLEDDQ